MENHRYDHTQFGTVLLVCFVVVIATAATVYAVLPPDTSRAGLYFTTAFLAAMWLLFGWLSVRIADDALEVTFGIGLVRKRIPLASITKVEVVRNKWWWGFGIRATPTGWMYNVSGLDAVLLHLDNDKKFRLGTDDADGLAKALDTD